MASVVVIVLAVVVLALAAWLFLQEPAGVTRVAAAGGFTAGLLLALLIALATGKSAADSVAIALLGGGVLALVLLGQMRLFRGADSNR